ncbi:ATP-dependent DNA helicase [Bacteroides pyogenes]|uniref:ATP-dependent DNA helicase n=1 Tax=Bacteroides pyogenes TaxID=310300 RepID=UPI001BAC83ED|nr:AAA family ATPase [Bacteroides pyogenes]MBR8723970.1 ATP-dependent RecD-like DNA helicase [Bacteroides pyogenes]MBR8737011.1 ATP-dependent RecD-like DNA helicase [Bacteroides pyogenes]MBR8753094.1 ATP-dependent RecD-like DNA helicase [Bacteroides pyogenes]MBR8794428.1 ATP-dependent RecD-like DNA helicase [Bacteroides pyogenes]MBR8808083.1 ATP-dependent RecD-like DNA helicase [Bacteroides pyogenes]
MINNYLERQIKENFPYQPTFEQEIAVKSLSDFLLSRVGEEVFILRGYAGTGKTSLIGALVKTLDRLQQKTVLLAPTGRAAKVFANYAGHPAFTIHKKIYRQRSFSNELDNFSVNENLFAHTLFIVDEASMISNEGLSGTMFGTGRLLDDLIQFVYSGEGCRLLLMGDTAQLPPVGEEMSPALFADALKGYGLKVHEADLTQVVRQEQDSGILWNATQLRHLIVKEDCHSLPRIKASGFPDVKIVSGTDLIEELSACYDRDGMEETIVVCRSNKRANLYNNGIRAQILWREDELNSGDILMIAKNNYYWTEQYKELDFLANGELAVVRRVRKTREMYGFRFAEATLAFPDQNGAELDATLLLDTLHSDAPALPKEANDRLFYTILEDYADIPLKRDRMKKMKADPYYNALQVKYAYAVTCHKAQGGQWKNVFLDQGYMTDEFLTPEYFRWLYTAFTRATKTLYLVNYPEKQIL